MTPTHRTAVSALLVLSLAAAGVPAASARPAGPEVAGPAHHTRALYSREDKSLLPPTGQPSVAATTSGPRSEGVSGGGYGSAAPAVGRAALLRSLAQQERHHVAGLAAYREGQLATALEVAATAGDRASAAQAVVRVHAPQGGFDWGDAGIGAAGGIALVTVALGGAFGVSQNRARRTRHTTALPS